MHKSRRSVASGIWWPELVVVTCIIAAFLLVDAIGVPARSSGDQVTSRDRESRSERDRAPR